MLLADPARAEAEPAAENDCLLLSDPGFVVDSEATALDLAAKCGRPVEVDAMREDAARFTAEIDGTVTAELFAAPQWTTDTTGEWVDIDPTLTVDENGLIAAAAVPGDVTVSGGGSLQPLAAMTTEAGESLDLWWPTELPEPVLEGAQARYAGVIDGVDLVVEAGRTGFSYRLEVLTAEAAANPELAEITVELGGTLEFAQDPETGAVTAADPVTGEAVLAANQALMWDASEPSEESQLPGPMSFFAEAMQVATVGSDEDPGDPGRVERMPVTLDGAALSVVPDAAMLADPETVFPVVIDPSFEAPQWAWATVGDEAYADSTWWDDAVWPRSGGLRMGFNGWAAPGEEGYGTWRSMIRFNIDKLRHSTVSSATMSLDVRHTGGCLSYPLELWQTNAITAGAVPTSWNSTAGKWLHGAPLDSRTVQSANSAGGCTEEYPTRTVNFSSTDLTDHVNRHANVPYASITLGLKAAVENNREHWFRADVATAHMTVVYQPSMSTPSDLTVGGVGCLAPEAARVTGTQPVLSAVPHSSDGEARMSYWVADATGATVASHQSSSAVPAEQAYAWQVGTPLPEGTYEFRARSNTTDGVTAQYTTWCTFAVDPTLDLVEDVSVAALTCPYDTTGLDPAVDTLESSTEGGALLLAEACAFGVEVTGLQDYTTRVVADPDGFLTAQHETLPAWAPDETGEWVEVDTGFTQQADGTITTAAAVSDITVSPGGTGPFVTATAPEGGSVSLIWPSVLPAPVVVADTVTYSEVMTGVDLQVTSDVDGFSYALIVKNPEAAADPALAAIDIEISADGLTVTQDELGAINAIDATGETVFSAPAAYMWDASLIPDPAADPEVSTLSATEEEPVSDLGEDDAMPGLYAEVGVDLAGSTLTVVPDATLLSDPDAQFPITIDPPFAGKRLAWANIFKSKPGSSWSNDKDWPRQGGMRVGYNIWPRCSPDACGLWRSAVRFDIAGLKGKDVLTAQVSMTQTHSGGCGSSDLAIYDVNRKMTDKTTWNSITSATLDHLQTKSVASSNSTGNCSSMYPDRDVNFTGSQVKSKLNSRLSDGRDWMTFMVRSANESDPYAWRRIDIKSVELIATYNSPAKDPTSLRTNGKDCVTSGYSSAPWTSEVQPTLSGIPHDPDGKTGARIEVLQQGSSKAVRTWSTSRNQNSGSRQTWIVPSGKKLSSGEYRWRMQSLDNYVSGSDNWFNSWCYFRIDTTAPTPPKVELVSPANPQAGDTVTFRLTSSDAHSGMSGFHYGINEDVPRNHAPATSGTTTIEVTAPSGGGRVWLYVWAGDKAGNSTKRMQVDFFAPRVITPIAAAAWRLDGDGLDDAAAFNGIDIETGTKGSAPAHDLTIGRSSGFTGSGSQSPPGQAMVFGGSDCVSTDGPVIRTDVPYTVAAWVRLDNADGNIRTVLSQSGRNNRGFALRYRGTSNEWDLVLVDQDVRSPSSYLRAASTTAPVVDKWTHLAATVDPATKSIQLWVDGTLEATRIFEHEAWHADGPVNIGCAGRTDPVGKFDYFQGAIQHAGVWQGLLTTADIQKVKAGDLPAGLAGEWLLRSDATDSSPKANHMTAPATGHQWVEDQWGRQVSAIDLDGTSCITAEDVAQNRSDGSFSAAAWVRPDSINTTSEQTVFGEFGGEYYKFKLRMWTDGRWGMSMGTGPTGTGTRNATAPLPAEIGQWAHLVAVYDAAGSKTDLYVNGTLAATTSVTFTPWQGSGKVNIGCRGTASGASGGGHFNGSISDAQLWRGALTADQVSALYGGNPAAEREANWPLNSKTTTDTQSGYDLSLHGGAGSGYAWAPNRANQRDSAIQFKGTGWAEMNPDPGETGSLIATDASFSVAAWVRLDEKTDSNQVFLSQAGTNRVGFNLIYSASADAFEFAVPSADTSGTVTWHKIRTSDAANPIPIETGTWYHLAAVADIPNQRLYLFLNGEPIKVNGQQDPGAPGTATPWNATGPFVVGAYATLSGTRSSLLHGRVDGIQVWSSTVDPDRIADMANASTLATA